MRAWRLLDTSTARLRGPACALGCTVQLPGAPSATGAGEAAPAAPRGGGCGAGAVRALGGGAAVWSLLPGSPTITGLSIDSIKFEREFEVRRVEACSSRQGSSRRVGNRWSSAPLPVSRRAPRPPTPKVQTAADHPEHSDWEDGVEMGKQALLRGKALFDGCTTLGEMRERLRRVAARAAARRR